jgi:glycosyltransferase involved in cell wall biosynthesis
MSFNTENDFGYMNLVNSEGVRDILVGIDAINIRQGGGLTHLKQLLCEDLPAESKVSQVTVWCNQEVNKLLPDKPWLVKISKPWMNYALPIRAAGQQFILPLYLRRKGCHVLFSPGGTIPHFSPVPCVVMCQNMLPFDPHESKRFRLGMRLKLALLRCIQGKSFRVAAGVIYLTGYAELAVSKLMNLDKGKSTVIPHGIEERFNTPPRLGMALSDFSWNRPFRFLYVSIAMPYKHQIAVAHAISQLRSEGIPICIEFVGASWGAYGKELRSSIHDLDPEGEFLIWEGEKPFQSIEELYRQADGFVFASTCENLPNILIEAMAAGLPIACSDKAPMPELLGEGGLYFSSTNPISIAKAVRKIVIEREESDAKSVLSWHRAQAFSWRQCATDTLSFLEEVVRSHHDETKRVQSANTQN